MRVAHIITRLIIGGAQENTVYNCEDLVRDFADEVFLLTGPSDGPEGDLVERVRRAGIPLIVIPTLQRAVSPLPDWKAYRDIRRELKRLAVDVVHTHSSKAGIAGRAAAVAERVPAVVHTIHGLPFHPYERWWRNRLYITLERWAAHRCHRIISVADAMTRQALAVGVGHANQYRTIYSGMEVEPFLDPPVAPAQTRARLGIPTDALVVGKVARLFELKGHDDVITAASALCRKHPSLCFLFVGGGSWEQRLRRRIADEGLSDRFYFSGLVPPSQVPELIAATDLVVHASFREGLARVLPQALLSGKPVVTYDIDGAAEVAIPGSTGELVPPGDISGLTAALDRLLREPERRQAYGQQGRQRFTDQFGHRTMTEHIRRLYEEVLANPQPLPW